MQAKQNMAGPGADAKMSEDFDGAFDLIIAGGTVIDGTRRARFETDVGIVGERIIALGNLSLRNARRRIEAGGKMVAPGFIDSHTHDDVALLSQPLMEYKVSQGVTTVVTGNCGISLAPSRPGMPMPMPLSLLRQEHGDTATFPRFSDYLDALRGAPASVNVAALVGHTTLRAQTMAELNRDATRQERLVMADLLEQALEDGAFGLSTGTFYPPAAKASTEEIIEVGQPLTRFEALYATHMRNEAEGTLTSLEETFAIGRALNIAVGISHHKLQGEANFGKSAMTLPLIRAAMKCQCVSLDCYPYTASSTMLHTDPAKLQCRVLIASSEGHPEMAGRDLSEIALQWNVSRAEAAGRLQPAAAIYFSMDEGDVRNILSFDDTMIGSDGIPSADKPHPRLWGAFPRVLGHYSRDIGLFSLETAVWKMSGLTARNFGLKDRGTIALGNFADLVIFDAASVIDKASYASPIQAAEGIDVVLVNGRVTWETGRHSGARNGQVLTPARSISS